MKPKLTTHRWALAITSVGAAALAACYPSPDLGVEDFDTVVTVVADDADFSGLRTYFMPDTVLQRPDDGAASRAFDDQIVSDINRNLVQRGYEYEPDPESSLPDLLVVASVITRDQYQAYLGWPYFGPGLGGGFVYPTVGMRYVYTVGTISIDMARAEDFDPDKDDFPVLWTAAISGPLVDSQSSRGERITAGIDQAFAQSPYLKPD
jgi:hypothetical protein